MKWYQAVRIAKEVSILHERDSLLPYMYVASYVVISIHINTTSFHIPLDSEFVVITIYTFDSVETSRADTWSNISGLQATNHLRDPKQIPNTHNS
jgi:hypothetical protein